MAPRAPAAAVPLVLVLLGALLLGLVLALPTGTPPRLTAYNSGWEDASELRQLVLDEGYRVGSISATPQVLDIDDRSPALVIILGMERPFTSDEMASLTRFVDRGGRVLLADDGALADRFAMQFGVHFIGTPLYSDQFLNNPAFVQATGRLENTSYRVLLDGPSAVEGHGDEVLRSAGPAWLDGDRDGERDLEEVEQVRSIGLRVDRGTGSLVFISDPGIFINDVIVLAENRGFARSLVRGLLGPTGTVIFDESRHGAGSHAESARRLAYQELLATPGLLIPDIVILLIAGGTGFVVVHRLQPLEDLIHRTVLFDLRPRRVRPAPLSAEDAGRVRRAIGEQLRVRMDLSAEEFEALSPAEIRSSLGDPVLAGVLLGELASVGSMSGAIAKLRGTPAGEGTPSRPAGRSPI